MSWVHQKMGRMRRVRERPIHDVDRIREAREIGTTRMI
jgi:hypothetical protein